MQILRCSEVHDVSLCVIKGPMGPVGPKGSQVRASATSALVLTVQYLISFTTSSS